MSNSCSSVYTTPTIKVNICGKEGYLVNTKPALLLNIFKTGSYSVLLVGFDGEDDEDDGLLIILAYFSIFYHTFMPHNLNYNGYDHGTI